MQDHIFVLLMQTGTSVAKVLQFLPESLTTMPRWHWI